MKKFFKETAKLFSIILISGLLVVSACSNSDSDKSRISDVEPVLRQAIASAQYMTSQRFLMRTAFSSRYPDQKPSEFISYIFSPMASSEWPVAMDEFEREQLESVRIPVMPNEVGVVANQPIPDHEYQVVFEADDANGIIIIAAYEEFGNKLVYTTQKSLK